MQCGNSAAHACLRAAEPAKAAPADSFAHKKGGGMEKGRRSLAAAPFVFQLLDIRLVFIQIEAK